MPDNKQTVLNSKEQAAATLIQKCFRGHRARRKYQAKRSAATLIQKYFRRYSAMKKYHIERLKEEERESYMAYPVGTDPCLPTSALDKFASTEDAAFIGCSCFRSLDLALSLSRECNMKLIIVDYSSPVIELWVNLRKYLVEDSKGSVKLFLANLVSFFETNEHLIADTEKCSLDADFGDHLKVRHNGRIYFGQGKGRPQIFFKYLIKKHGFKAVSKMIKSVSLIPQSWENPNVLLRIKKILNDKGINRIYMYPSNMVAFDILEPVSVAMRVIEEASSRQILTNIQEIRPYLVIHTDCCRETRWPRNYYLFEEDYRPDQVFKAILGREFTTNGTEHETVVVPLWSEEVRSNAHRLSSVLGTGFFCDDRQEMKLIKITGVGSTKWVRAFMPSAWLSQLSDRRIADLARELGTNKAMLRAPEQACKTVLGEEATINGPRDKTVTVPLWSEEVRSNARRLSCAVGFFGNPLRGINIMEIDGRGVFMLAARLSRLSEEKVGYLARELGTNKAMLR